jgi:ribosome-associated protein
MTENEQNDRGEDATEARLSRQDKADVPSNHEAAALAQAAAQLAWEKKAADIRILAVTGVCSYADYFVICSAPSERQAGAIARSVDDGLRRGGQRPLSSEGLKQGNWALLDYGDVVVHVFLDSAREYYDLEGFWSDAGTLDFDESAGIAALDQMGLTPAGESKVA